GLAEHVAEVGLLGGLASIAAAAWRRQRVFVAAAEHARGAAQRVGDGHAQAVDESRLARAAAAEDQRGQAVAQARLRDRERAARRAYAAVERELAEQRVAIERVSRDLAARGEHRAGERQVECGARLRHVARRE